MTDVVTVSPREITDLVYRACRVAGCGASLSETIAADVTYCEIHFGCGVDGVLELIETSPCRLREHAIEAHARHLGGPRSRDNSGTKAGPESGTKAGPESGTNVDSESDDVPSPFVLRCRLEAHADLHGGAHGGVHSGDQYRQALAAGVDLSASSWARLERQAIDFLLAEGVIDGN